MNDQATLTVDVKTIADGIKITAKGRSEEVKQALADLTIFLAGALMPWDDGPTGQKFVKELLQATGLPKN